MSKVILLLSTLILIVGCQKKTVPTIYGQSLGSHNDQKYYSIRFTNSDYKNSKMLIHGSIRVGSYIKDNKLIAHGKRIDFPANTNLAIYHSETDIQFYKYDLRKHTKNNPPMINDLVEYINRNSSLPGTISSY